MDRPAAPAFREPSSRGAIIDAVLQAAIATVVYQVAHRFGASDINAIVLAGIYPALVAVVGLVRRRTLDPVSGIILFGLVVSAVGYLLGGGPRVFLIRESFVSGALGIACFVTLLTPRPLMYYFGRWFSSRGDAALMREYDKKWDLSYGFRFGNRVITCVWGVAFFGEFVIRAVLAYTLPIPVVLAIGPIVSAAIVVGTLAWTFAYVRWARKKYGSDPDPVAA
jgi:hypothetical protein